MATMLVRGRALMAALARANQNRNGGNKDARRLGRPGIERGHGCAEACELGAREQAEEMLLMGLRLSEGLDVGWLHGRTGLFA